MSEWMVLKSQPDATKWVRPPQLLDESHMYLSGIHDLLIDKIKCLFDKDVILEKNKNQQATKKMQTILAESGNAIHSML